MQYFLALCLIGLSTYLIYSATGSKNSIPGFNENVWWQYLIALIPMAVGVTVIIVCESQSLVISRRQNQILIMKKRCCCLVTQRIQRQFQQINGLSVIKKGGSKANGLYYIVISFKTCQSYQILGCISSLSIAQYFEQLRSLFSQQQISQHRILIQELQLAQ